MYIEHRQYTFHPGKQPTWVDAFGSHGFPSSVRTLGAPSMGTFTVEVGTINRFVFMRGWDDIDTRDAGLAAREADPQWNEFKKLAAGCIMSQEVKFLKPTSFSPIQSAKGFAFKREIFDYIGEGEELVVEPFIRLIEKGRLSAMKYEGFWCPMDTYKDKTFLDDIYARGDAPWEVWRRNGLAPVRSLNHARFAS